MFRDSRAIGYRGLLVLVFALPFNLERARLLRNSSVTITNVTALAIAVAVVALLTVTQFGIQALRGSPDAIEYFSRRRLPLALFAASLLSTVISTVLAPTSAQGLSWPLDMVTGALIWLALPLWLRGHTQAKINRVGDAMVSGATVSGIIGLIEIVVGPAFDRYLLLFKFGPNMMGPFLRLSATFSSANLAAMYFELALVFAGAGLIGLLGRSSPQWKALTLRLAAVDILVVALALTYTRGTLLGMLAVVFAVPTAGRHALRPTAVVRRGEAAVVAVNLGLLLGMLVLTLSPIERLRFSTQSDRIWYRATFVGKVPTTMTAARARTIPVVVENRSPLDWNASTPHTYGLSYHWLRETRAVVRFSNTITWLSSDLQPGGRQAVSAQVMAPRVAGRYLLVWDLVWEGTTWFDARTGMYRVHPVRVVQPEGREHSEARIHPARPDITHLPRAVALGRGQIWAVAIRMIEHRPLFGLGPQGVHAQYNQFVSGASVPHPPSHAHDLALEILADWGLVGGGLFAALLISLWWPLLRRAWTGRVEYGWELAVIGAGAALFGHQLVDYFLTKETIFALLWLLCGLAATTIRHPAVQVPHPTNMLLDEG